MSPSQNGPRARRIGADERIAAPTCVAASPQLWIADDFVPPDEVSALLSFLADEHRVTAAALFAGPDSAGYAAEFAADAEPCLRSLCARIERATGVSSALEPTLRMRAYAQGERHPPHCDSYVTEGHQLAVTALVFLVDTEAGGETAFPQTSEGPVAVAPRAGRLVAWTSALDDGSPDPASLHEGCAVTHGEKAVLIAFMYRPVGEPTPRLRFASA